MTLFRPLLTVLPLVACLFFSATVMAERQPSDLNAREVYDLLFLRNGEHLSGTEGLFVRLQNVQAGRKHFNRIIGESDWMKKRAERGLTFRAYYLDRFATDFPEENGEFAWVLSPLSKLFDEFQALKARRPMDQPLSDLRIRTIAITYFQKRLGDPYSASDFKRPRKNELCRLQDRSNDCR